MMDTTRKKTFFGSFFEFSDSGYDELINDYRLKFSDHGSVPFIGYDKQTHLFYCEAEDDDEAVQDFTAQFESFLEKQLTQKTVVIDEPRIHRLAGTVVSSGDELSDTNPMYGRTLVDYDEDSDDSDDSSAIAAKSAVYWKPKCGNIAILPETVVRGVAKLTGCFFIPEKTTKRVKILSGNVASALAKLERLEDVMECQYRHRGGVAASVDSNFLLFSSPLPGTSFVFLSASSESHVDRVMVTAELAPQLPHQVLTEQRDWIDQKYWVPESVKTLPSTVTDRLRASRLWDEHRFPTVGQPYILSLEADSGRLIEKAVDAVDEEVDTLDPGYLEPHERARVSEWTKNLGAAVEPTVDDASLAESRSANGHKPRRKANREATSKKYEMPKTVVESADARNTNTGRYGPLVELMSEIATDRSSEVSSREPRAFSGSGQLESGRELVKDHLTSIPSQFSWTPAADGPVDKDGNYGPFEALAKDGTISHTGARKKDEQLISLVGWQEVPARRKVSAQPEHGSSSTKHAEENRLIDFEETEPSPVMIQPPPGFDIHPPPIQKPIPNLLDDPIEEETRASTKLSRRPRAQDTYEAATSSSSSSGAKAPRQGFIPQGTNIGYLQQQKIAQLLEGRAKEQKKKMASPNDEAPGSSQRASKKNNSKENRSSTVASSVSQKRFPAKGKATETKKERDERIARAKADAYGETHSVVSKKPAMSTVSSSTGPAKLSTGARKVMKSNHLLASLHPETIQTEARKEQTRLLTPVLKKLFEAARAFPGRLNFEVQFGQTLIAKSDRFATNTIYDERFWSVHLQAKSGSIPVHFTNMLTNNGDEVDRFLEAGDPEQNTVKLWDSEKPTTQRIVLEFTCQHRSGLQFQVILDENGEHVISNPSVTVGKVGIHFPGRVWDACAVLEGTVQKLDVSSEISQCVDEFVQSIHVDHEKHFAIFYKLPMQNALIIRNVVVKKTSEHVSLLPAHHDLRLRVTEVQSLYMTKHTKDKGLYQSFERGYEKMTSTCRVHYELAVSDTTINKALEENMQLELGEATSAETTGSSIVDQKWIDRLLDATTRSVEQMNGIGIRNVGSLRRWRDEQARKNRELSATIPPSSMAFGSRRQVPVPVGHRVSASQVLARGATSLQGSKTNSSELPIYGVRAGTQAEIYRDTDGSLFRYGLGGARIPVIADGGMHTINEDEVRPDDSASQAGVLRKPTERPRDVRATKDDKPPGFW